MRQRVALGVHASEGVSLPLQLEAVAIRGRGRACGAACQPPWRSAVGAVAWRAVRTHAYADGS